MAELANEAAQVAIGQPMPDFELAGLDGKLYRLSHFAGWIVVLDFWSAECPWSRHYDAWLDQRAAGWAQEQILLLAIASNANESRDMIETVKANLGIKFPVLPDPRCAVASLVGARTTPHVYVVDRQGRLAYQGAIDDRTFRRRQPTVNYLEQALDALQAGQAPQPAQTEPYGCVLVCHTEESASPSPL